jgi:transposase
MGESKDGTSDSGAPVVIGMDPHKRTVTIEVMSASEQVVGHGRFTTDEAGFAAMLD